jgi:hypothetical protein
MVKGGTGCAETSGQRRKVKEPPPAGFQALIDQPPWPAPESKKFATSPSKALLLTPCGSRDGLVSLDFRGFRRNSGRTAK